MTTRRTALCAGSFDPLTRGHEDVVRRALAVVDHVVVAVSHSPTSAKSAMFSVPERVEMIREAFADEPRVEAAQFQGLLVEFARTVGASVLVRGVRSVADWEYELGMAQMNRKLARGLETVGLPADPEHGFVTGTLVRQVASLGGDVSGFVSPAVLARLQARRA